MSGEHILRNLHSLIRNSSLKYMNEFIWQDIELTDEFKNAYKNYLNTNYYDIEFLGNTAVITSPATKYIYVPNQWFVIASYAVDVYEELHKYKSYFKLVSDKLNEKPEEYARRLRDNPSPLDKNIFLDTAKTIFSELYSDQDMINESASRLWRFVNDYSWWSGQKTIDRGDFYKSVILNMLNLVNTSQGFVGDIVNAYASDHKLRDLVKSIDKFTLNISNIDETEANYFISDEEDNNYSKVSDSDNEDILPKPQRVRIKVKGSNQLKEVKYKG